MPAGHDVRPAKWSKDTIDLFDNGRYSAVWGRYGVDEHKSLGVRWNADEGELGFPNQAGNPIWYVEPPFLVEPILKTMMMVTLQEEQKGSPRHEEYVRNLKIALKQFWEA